MGDSTTSNCSSNSVSADCEDCVWQAFCYLAGEMSADQQAEFERRLQNDSDACDSLIEVCSLTESVFDAFEAESRESSSDESNSVVVSMAPNVGTASPRKISVWVSQMACLVALVGVGVALWLTGGGADNGLSHNTVYSQTEASELVGRWKSASEVVPPELVAVSEFDSELNSDIEAVFEEASDEDIPEWLLVALQSEQD